MSENQNKKEKIEKEKLKERIKRGEEREYEKETIRELGDLVLKHRSLRGKYVNPEDVQEEVWSLKQLASQQ